MSESLNELYEREKKLKEKIETLDEQLSLDLINDAKETMDNLVEEVDNLYKQESSPDNLLLLFNAYYLTGLYYLKLYRQNGNLETAYPCFANLNQALSICKSAPKTMFSKRDIISLYIDLTFICSKIKMDPKDFKESVKLAKKNLELKNPIDLASYSMLLLNLGDCYIQRDKLKKAIGYFKLGIKFSEKRYVLLHNQGIEIELVELYKKLITIYENSKFKRFQTLLKNRLYHLENYN